MGVGFRFQSTPSVGRATGVRIAYGKNMTISIHALRGEGDDNNPNDGNYYCSISIHALRGEGDEVERVL